MHIIVFLTLLCLVTQPVLTQQPTQKELQEQMQQMAKELNKQIADQLSISASIIRQHIHCIYEKLHVQNRTEAINKAFGKN